MGILGATVRLVCLFVFNEVGECLVCGFGFEENVVAAGGVVILYTFVTCVVVVVMVNFIYSGNGGGGRSCFLNNEGLND